MRGKLAIGAATAVLALGWVTAVGPADPTCPANTGGPASACSAAARAWAARS